VRNPGCGKHSSAAQPSLPRSPSHSPFDPPDHPPSRGSRPRIKKIAQLPPIHPNSPSATRLDLTSRHWSSDGQRPTTPAMNAS
jgi:hypothetical protein